MGVTSKPVQRPSAYERAITKTVPSDTWFNGSPCLVFTGCRNNNGYGKVGNLGKTLYTHRVAYIEMVGEIPTGMQIDHLCRTRACMNHLHLELVTARENLLRGDTLPGVNFRKVVCTNGHPYTESNTYTHPISGHRTCRTCHRQRVADATRRKK